MRHGDSTFDTVDEEFYRYGLDQLHDDHALSLERVRNWFQRETAHPDAELREAYWVLPPFIFVEIRDAAGSESPLYLLRRPAFLDHDRPLAEFAADQIGVEFDQITDYTRAADLIDQTVHLTDAEFEYTQPELYETVFQLREQESVYRQLLGIVEDPAVEHIICNGPDRPVFISHREHGSLQSNIEFTTNEVAEFVQHLSESGGSPVQPSAPMATVGFDDGSLAQVCLGEEVTSAGSTFSIDVYEKHRWTPLDLLEQGTYNAEILAYLWTLIGYRKNVFVHGDIYSGKTRTLEALSYFIPEDHRVLTLEEHPRLSIPHENQVTATYADPPSAETVLGNLLEQRVEHIVFDDLKNSETQLLFEALDSGRTTLASIHAGTTGEAIKKLTTPPMDVSLPRLAYADLFCCQTRARTSSAVKSDRKHRANILTEVRHYDSERDDIHINDVFEWEPDTDSFTHRLGKDTNLSDHLKDLKKDWNVDAETVWREIHTKEQVLTVLHENNWTTPDVVHRVITEYDRQAPQVRQLYQTNDVEPWVEQIVAEHDSATNTTAEH